MGAKKKTTSRAAGAAAATTTAGTKNEDLFIRVVIPGDDVTDVVLSSKNEGETQESAAAGAAATASLGSPSNKTTKAPKIGQGLVYDAGKQKVKTTLAGRLIQHQSNNNSANKVYYVQQNIRRYRPEVEDRVVGIVEDRVGPDGKGGDYYRVNIVGPHPAILSNLAFEGATKRNKPYLFPGMLIYARIQTHMKTLDPELSCMNGPRDVGVPRKAWMTHEGIYGELKGGTATRIPLGLARELLRPTNVVLEELNRHKLPFEVAIGVNGFLWIHSNDVQYTILIQNAILNSQVMTDPQVRAMVKSLVFTVQKQMQQDMDQD